MRTACTALAFVLFVVCPALVIAMLSLDLAVMAEYDGSAYVTTPDDNRLVVESVTFYSSGLQPMPTGGVKLKIKWADSRCVAGWVVLGWNEKANTVTATNANKRDMDKCP